MSGYVWDVCRCAGVQVCTGVCCAGVHGCERMCMAVCMAVSAGACGYVLNEFSEYLLET